MIRTEQGSVSVIPKGAHTFHIPVMGTGFTIDTPLRVAKYGISSAISLVDDVLIEQMRKFYCDKEGEPYEEIPPLHEDVRALRITAYLNRLVRRQVEDLQASPFEEGSEITRYFEMLPESLLKRTYHDMLATTDQAEKARIQEVLRRNALPGSIDINIMIRLDDFFPDSKGMVKKKIILKVSDFRSAMVQGRFLAKQGLWTSEYRIESGLNCGGHAFATRGILMGPTLGRPTRDLPCEINISVQGGIGAAWEDEFLQEYYKVDGTGWGTPFLLVPEVTNVDSTHLKKLLTATDQEVCLSNSSPLGIPFWILGTATSEKDRCRRILEGKPGHPCVKKFGAMNTEFTEVPICLASRGYVKRKLEHLSEGVCSEKHSPRPKKKCSASPVSAAALPGACS